MKTTLIALATATFAVLATPAAAATVAAPVADTNVVAAEVSAQTAELRGKRRSAIRHKRYGKIRHRGHLRSSRFHHDRRLKAKSKHHFKHHDRFVHDPKFKHHRVHPHRTIKKGYKAKRIGYRGF